MLKQMGLAVALMGAFTLPALAQTDCVAPVAPAAVNGASATKPQMLSAVADVKAFIAASDTYQVCLGNYLTAQRAAAVTNKTPFDANIEKDIAAKVTANQAMKEKMGGEINASLVAFKAAQPK